MIFQNKITYLFLLLMLNTITDTTFAQKCDKTTFNWKKAGKLPDISSGQENLGYAGPVTGVFNNLLLIAGGANFPEKMPWLGGRKKHYNDVYLFKKTPEGELINIGTNAKLPFEVAYAASCSTPFGVFYTGGEYVGGLSNKAYLLKFNEKEFLAEQLPNLPYAVANASAHFSGTYVYLAGGETTNGASSNFIRLNLDFPEKGWQELPEMPQATSHGIMAIPPNGNGIYFIGGRKANKNTLTTFYSDVFMFDPQKQEWVRKAALPYTLAAGTGGAVDDNYIYVFGGDKGIVFNQTETLINAITQETDELKKQKLNGEKIQLQTSHPGFSREILSYHIDTDSWHTAGILPFETPVTTTVVKWDNEVVIPSGEIKAGVRSPYIILSEIEKKHKK